MKLTKKDYDWCYKKMKYWQDKLGMRDKIINIEIKEFYDDTLGECFCKWENKSSHISLSSNAIWKNKKQVEKTIFHEMCESMLWEINAELRINLSDEKSQHLIHSVIRRLENLMFET